MPRKHLTKSKRRAAAPKRPRFKGAEAATKALAALPKYEASLLELFGTFTLDVRGEYAWTKDIPGYQEAFDSIKPALVRSAMRCDFLRTLPEFKDSEVDSVLYSVSSGDLAPDAPRVIGAIVEAFVAGRTHIYKELHDATLAAGKLKPRVHHFADGKTTTFTGLGKDLSLPHVFIALNWVGQLFWLMGNEAIAAHLVNMGALPKCARTTVAAVVKELNLHRHPKPCVGSAQGGKLIVPGSLAVEYCSTNVLLRNRMWREWIEKEAGLRT